MTIEKTSRPYEFLVRWGGDGTIQGAHIQFIDEVKDGDEILAAKVGHAQVVSLAGETGFPLADVLTELHCSALAAMDVANATSAQAQAAQRAEQEKCTAMQSKLDAVTAELSMVKTRLQAAVTDTRNRSGVEPR